MTISDTLDADVARLTMYDQAYRDCVREQEAIRARAASQLAVLRSRADEWRAARDQAVEELLSEQVAVARRIAQQVGVDVRDVPGLEWAVPDARFELRTGGRVMASLPNGARPGQSKETWSQVPSAGVAKPWTRHMIRKYLTTLLVDERRRQRENLLRYIKLADQFPGNDYFRRHVDQATQALAEPTHVDQALNGLAVKA